MARFINFLKMSVETNPHSGIADQGKNNIPQSEYQRRRTLMLGDTCQKHTFFGDVGIVGRMSGKLFDDTTLKSYAYWYDPDELMRVRLGRRGQPDHEPTLKEKLLNFFI